MPCLLLHEGGLVKTRQFSSPRYVGDPINAVRIYNEKEVDELVFLDISATGEQRGPSYELTAAIASECFMPFCVGGGIGELSQIESLLRLGVEKVAINTIAAEKPDFVEAAAQRFGSQSIVVSVDVKRTLFGSYGVYTRGGTKNLGVKPEVYARHMEELGAGEILLTSIDRDGTMKGYDLELTRSVAAAVTVPVIACGGAGSVADLAAVTAQAGASAAAAGSLFVYHGKHRAVLINFPARAQLDIAMPNTC
jgi:cyclase